MTKAAPTSGLNPADRSAPALTIVIPAYNEEGRLPGTLAEIARWVDARDSMVEVVVVENGSTDGTVGVVRAFQDGRPWLRLIRDVPRGKGLAVREGILAARGKRRFLCDADLSMPIDELDRFLTPELADVDVVIGSREAPGARRVGEPRHARIIPRNMQQHPARREALQQVRPLRLMLRRRAPDAFAVAHRVSGDCE